MNTRLFSLCFVLAFASFVFAAPVQFKINYVLTDSNLYPNGEVPGTLYYRYDADAPQTSKVRYEHTLSAGGKQYTIVELEDFAAGKVFKICDKTCEAYPLSRTAQKWWYVAGDSKTNEKDGDYTRYTRAVANFGVSELWLKNEDAPTASAFYTKKLSFSTGSTLNFAVSSYSTTGISDDKFNPNAGGVTCSSTTCRTYMDLIFVLDSSASVGSTNWNKMVGFVKDVVQQTDVSAQSAAIAVTGFGGKTCNKYKGDCQGEWHNGITDAEGNWVEHPTWTPMDGAFDAKKNNKVVARCGYTSVYKWSMWGGYYEYTYYPPSYSDTCKKADESSSGYSASGVSGDYCYDGSSIVTCYNRCGKDFNNCSYSKTPFISDTYVSLTYKNKDDILKDIQNNVKYEEGDTCQALGLIKVMDLLHKKNRANENAGAVPQRVVIVLTDGADHCAESTRKYINVLRTKYNAVVIEVGIGLEGIYDKMLLQDLASKFNGEPAYFDITDFSALTNLIDKMVSTVCQTDYNETSGNCDPKCHGFCGCGGECYCPTCSDGLNTKCQSVSCRVDNGQTAGCSVSPFDCNDNLYCTEDTCNDQTGCVNTQKDCQVGLKTCQVSQCLETHRGQCKTPEKKDSLCPEPPYPCYKAICDPDNAESDSVTGCRYEYQCGGDFPAVYQDGQLISGCYEYWCDNTTRQCHTKDLCDEMSRADECKTYKCSRSMGTCMISNEKTCEIPDACTVEATCNSQTGECDYVITSASDCMTRLKEEAKNHCGETGWLATENEVEAHFKCGKAECDPDSYVSSDQKTLNHNGNCVFIPGDEDTCGVCSGTLETQMSFEKCAAKAIEDHNKDKTKCYTSSCVRVSDTESECNNTMIECPPKPCMDVVCNQETLKCEYTPTKEYTDAKKNVTACNKLECINNEPTLVDISEEKCNVEGVVPVCMIYDRCDATAGCLYKEKCVKEAACTTKTCDNKTNTCVTKPVVCEDSGNICFYYQCSPLTDKCEEVVRSVEDACGTTDACHELTCNILSGECESSEIPYPNDTDLCHIYTCENETGLWTVTEKCDDGNICTVDSCTLYDGSCTNFQRDCAELNMTGLGSCFGRACSKTRKNGCFRKVYENSYFDECGNCIRGYTAGDSGLTDSETSNCKKALTFQEEAAVISAGVLAAIIVACVIGAVAVSTAGTLATKELIRRAREANNSGSHDNPLFEEDGQEMENPTFVGNE
jgi:hypothetical protein